ncbi:MAG: hypothetical protein Q4G27_08895 [Flavobacteriaceae bacterium]|nr:hypothetical protein [Flavobacteriaceae bacterium]
MIRFWLIGFIFFTACQKPNNTIDSENKTEKLQLSISDFSINDNQLILNLSDGSTQTFSLESSEVEILISPDSQKLAVNERIMSNLQITHSYILNESTGKIIHKNESTQLWDKIENVKKINSDEIISPRTNALNWQGDSLQIQLQGRLESGQSLDTIFTITLN